MASEPLMALGICLGASSFSLLFQPLHYGLWQYRHWQVLRIRGRSLSPKVSARENPVDQGSRNLLPPPAWPQLCLRLSENWGETREARLSLFHEAGAAAAQSLGSCCSASGVPQGKYQCQGPEHSRVIQSPPVSSGLAPMPSS